MTNGDEFAGSHPRVMGLPDGRTLTVRAITRADVAALGALYASLTPDDLHSRFFSVFHPSPAFLERWIASVGGAGGFGFVAVTSNGTERIVGEAGYAPLPNGDGELAIAVAPDWCGWLGPYLLDLLLEAAAARGVPNLQADILLENRRMLALARALGYATLAHDDFHTVRLAIGTGGQPPARPAGREGPRVLVEAPGARWQAGAQARADGLRVVACPGPAPGAAPRCPALAGQPCPLAANADVIVFALRPDDARTRKVPDVPVCVDVETRAMRQEGVETEPMRVTADLGAREVVEVVRDLAARHAQATKPPRDWGPSVRDEIDAGTVGEGGAHLLNHGVVHALAAPHDQIDAIAARVEEHVAHRARQFRGNRSPLNVAGRTVLLVDDGLTTGATARAAVRVLRARGAGHIVVAVPAGSPEATEAVAPEVDEVICLERPDRSHRSPTGTRTSLRFRRRGGTAPHTGGCKRSPGSSSNGSD